jgi:solute:Na+ symporter, SSS family
MNATDWIVLVFFSFVSMGIGVFYTRSSARKGQEGFFTANRNLSWWSLGISNAATYQSGLGAFVMLIFMFGFSGNWLWWAQWIIWMPLVAVIWSKMWQRMKIVTTAELITIRYGGRISVLARRSYALAMCFFAVITIAYITGFFAKTVAPLMPMSISRILIVFGTITLIYTLAGGLMGSVMVSVIQMIIMIAGSMAFLLIIIPQHGGWAEIISRVALMRPETMSLNPVSPITPPLTLVMFVILGLFFAGSPTAGEGMTAQRFMAAKSEQHALGGQLFSAFISLSVRVLPLMGMGIICITLFFTGDMQSNAGVVHVGMKLLDDPAFAWGELIKASKLPAGFTGLLVATEVAAYMSTLSALLNWGGSFVVNDFYKQIFPRGSSKHEIVISRLTTVVIFFVSAAIAILFVKDMVSWFLFINSVVVIFWLPLAYFRFFWPRFNGWGELTATILGIPLSVFFWFILDFQNKPIWQGTGMLFLIAIVIIVAVTLLTPKEPDQVLEDFYIRCRPPAGWKRFISSRPNLPQGDITLKDQIADSILGILACLGMAMATNAVFVKNWVITIAGLSCMLIFGFLLIRRSLMGSGKIRQ